MTKPRLFVQGRTCICADTVLHLCNCQGGVCQSEVCVTQGDWFWKHARAKKTDITSTHADHLGEQIDFDFGIGFNWTFSAWPYITDAQNDTLLVVLPGYSLRFTWNSSTACYEGPTKYTLTYDKNLSRFTLVEPDGSFWYFRGFKPTLIPKGRFLYYQAANGDSASVTGYTGYGHITQIIARYRSNGSVAEEIYDYTYATFDDGAERLTTLTRRLQLPAQGVQELQRFNYSYFASGDLKSVTESLSLNSEWVAQELHHYRYYEETESVPPHLLKYVLEPEQYAALAADPDVEDPLTASEEEVAEYATYYFEYDANQQVSLQRPLSGGEVRYTYQDGNLVSMDPNVVRRTTVATQADGSQLTCLLNPFGKPLIHAFSASPSSIDFYQYNSDGELTLHATPSAVEDYQVDVENGYTVTPTYRSEGGVYDVGLIYLHTYYSETTTGTGGSAVKGRREYDQIQQGRDGTPIKLRKYEYSSHTAEVEVGWLGLLDSSSSSSSSPVVAWRRWS